MQRAICIHQPDFIPFIGFFQKLIFSSELILLDDVQFKRRGWHNRDLIKNLDGQSVWLTVPIKKAPIGTLLKDIELLEESCWREKHLNMISACYSKSRFFHEVFPKVRYIYELPFVRLIDLNVAFLKFAFEYLDISPQLTYSSTHNIQTVGSSRILELVQKNNADTYITGMGSKNYIDEKAFSLNNVNIQWVEFKPFKYEQSGNNFLPGLSFLDLIFNCGKNSGELIKKNYRYGT